MKRLIALSVSTLVLGGILGVSSAPAYAASSPSANVTLSVTGCTFNFDYTWTDFHGGNLTGVVRLFRRDTGGVTQYDAKSSPGVSGRSGEFADSFVESGSLATNNFFADAYLSGGHGRILTLSQVNSSPDVPANC